MQQARQGSVKSEAGGQTSFNILPLNRKMQELTIKKKVASEFDRIFSLWEENASERVSNQHKSQLHTSVASQLDVQSNNDGL